MKPVEIRIIKVCNRTANLTLLEDFINSGMEVALVEDYPYKDARVCAVAIKRCIEEHDLNDIVEVFKRKEKVFLIRKD